MSCFISCHLSKGREQGYKAPLGFWWVVKKDAELLLISFEWGFRGVRRVRIFLLLRKGLLHKSFCISGNSETR